jgi:hypothetical protein
MSAKSLNFLKNFKVLNEFKEEDLCDIKLLYIFKDYENKSNLFIVKKKDKVLTFGENSFGVLGFGNEQIIDDSLINEELSHKEIIDFKNSRYHVIARTIDGKVYCWGYNYNGVLGYGRRGSISFQDINYSDNNIYKPQLNECLSAKKIIDICCGHYHSLALTNDGAVYAWGRNDSGQIGDGSNRDQYLPIRVHGFNNEKVIMISCGSHHSMALTESGRVYSWGLNNCGQLGISNTYETNRPVAVSVDSFIWGKIFSINNIEKISCGREHSLLLSRDGDIYAFGNNNKSQLGFNTNDNKQLFPSKLSINTNKFIDIKSHNYFDISIALSVNNKYYVWGDCGETVINKPKEYKFKSIDEVFALYFQITYKIIDFEKSFPDVENTGNGKYSKEFNELGLISFGCYSIVCKAFDKKSKKIFAIEKIPFEKKFEEKTLKEIEILLKIKNDFVVRLESVWIEDNYIEGEYYNSAENLSLKPSPEIFRKDKTLLLHIQMEYFSMTLKGLMKNLKQELNQKYSEIMTPLGYYIASELFIELLESVDYLHKQNIIHRNLKPLNIVITDGINDRFTRITGFGLVTIHDNYGQIYTKYTAPEIMTSKNYDIKSDIYSLGNIALQLFNIDINKY